MSWYETISLGTASAKPITARRLCSQTYSLFTLSRQWLRDLHDGVDLAQHAPRTHNAVYNTAHSWCSRNQDYVVSNTIALESGMRCVWVSISRIRNTLRGALLMTQLHRKCRLSSMDQELLHNNVFILVLGGHFSLVSSSKTLPRALQANCNSISIRAITRFLRWYVSHSAIHPTTTVVHN